MKKRWIFLVMALTLLAALAAPAAAEEPFYRIGVCQLEQHAALEEATKGFMDAFREETQDRCEFLVRSASGDPATCIAIVNAFLAEEVDLILANSTQALQAASAATEDTPILGVAVTDYPAALGMEEWNGCTGINVSGASDLAPLDEQALLLQSMFPEAKQVGLLYCSSEVNSVYQVREIRRHLEQLGYACADYAFTDTNDVFSVAQNACQNSDVLFVPTDNTVAACTELIRNVVEMDPTPIIGGDEAICAGCGVATICIDYYALGREAGRMAADVLLRGADPAQTPIATSPDVRRVVNAEMCAFLGVAIPEGCQLLGE